MMKSSSYTLALTLTMAAALAASASNAPQAPTLSQLKKLYEASTLKDTIEVLKAFEGSVIDLTAYAAKLNTEQQQGERPLATFAEQRFQVAHAQYLTPAELIAHVMQRYAAELSSPQKRALLILRMLLSPIGAETHALNRELKPALSYAEHQAIAAARTVGGFGDFVHRTPYRAGHGFEALVRGKDLTPTPREPRYLNTSCSRLGHLGVTARYYSSLTRKLAQAACLGFFCTQQHPQATLATTTPGATRVELAQRCAEQKLPTSPDRILRPYTPEDLP